MMETAMAQVLPSPSMARVFGLDGFLSSMCVYMMTNTLRTRSKIAMTSKCTVGVLFPLRLVIVFMVEAGQASHPPRPRVFVVWLFQMQPQATLSLRSMPCSSQRFSCALLSA